MDIFLRSYLSRIGWTGKPDISLRTLRELHSHHNSAIPFENLDVLLARDIHLDDQSLQDKLIHAHRGGYCFEQNGLFERALREIGFSVRSLLGRVLLANPAEVPPRTHRLLLVEIDDAHWIADVGFGGQTLTAPIQLLPNIKQSTPHGIHRLLNEHGEWTLQYFVNQQWQSMYRFDLSHTYFADYHMANFWTACWPQSHFRHHLVMARHLPEGGKMTLKNFHFTYRKNAQVIEKVDLPDVATLYNLIQTHFGLQMHHTGYDMSESQLAAVMATVSRLAEAK